MANGWSSREKSRLAVRRVHHTPKQDEHSMSITPVAPSDEDIVDVKPLQISRDTVQILGPKRSNLRLEFLFFISFGILFYYIFYLVFLKVDALVGLFVIVF